MAGFILLESSVAAKSADGRSSQYRFAVASGQSFTISDLGIQWLTRRYRESVLTTADFWKIEFECCENTFCGTFITTAWSATMDDEQFHFAKTIMTRVVSEKIPDAKKWRISKEFKLW